MDTSKFTFPLCVSITFGPSPETLSNIYMLYFARNSIVSYFESYEYFCKNFIDDLSFSKCPPGRIFEICFLLGVTISIEKCELQASRMKYLGVNVNMTSGVFTMLPEKATKLQHEITHLQSVSNETETFLIQYYLDKVSGKLGFYSLFKENETSRCLSSIAARFRLGRCTKCEVIQKIDSLKSSLDSWQIALDRPDQMTFDYRSDGLINRALSQSLQPTLYTDSGDNACAGVTACGKFMKQIIFEPSMCSLHINSKELYAAIKMLESSYLQQLYSDLEVKVDSKVALKWLETKQIPDSVSKDRDFLDDLMQRYKRLLPLYGSLRFSYIASKILS